MSTTKRAALIAKDCRLLSKSNFGSNLNAFHHDYNQYNNINLNNKFGEEEVTKILQFNSISSSKNIQGSAILELELIKEILQPLKNSTGYVDYNGYQKNNALGLKNNLFTNNIYRQNYFEERKEEYQWHKNQKIGDKNLSKNSTLSLHIEAYENNEIETKKNNNIFGDKKVVSLKKASKMDSFLFPRQQQKKDEEELMEAAEMMAFTFSRKCMNLNPMKNKYSALTFPSSKHVRFSSTNSNQFVKDIPKNTTEKQYQQSVEEEQKELIKMLKNEKWVPVYRFPGIAFSSLISKLKFLQTFGSALVIPWATYNYASGYQTFEFVATVYAAALLAPLTLFAFSRTFNRMIGVISMNESNEYIRVGYLTFYGTRKNAIIPVEDIMPLTDIVSTMEKYPSVMQLKRFSRPDQWFYVAGKGVHILDKERAKLVFGTLAAFLEMPKQFFPKQVDAAKDGYLKADQKLAKAEANYEKAKEDIINKYKNE